MNEFRTVTHCWLSTSSFVIFLILSTSCYVEIEESPGKVEDTESHQSARKDDIIEERVPDYWSKLVDGARFAGDRRAIVEQATVEFAEIEILGAMKEEQVRLVATKHKGRVKNCYTEGLQQKNNLAGELAVKWTIDQKGRVPSANVVEASLHSKTVQACLAEAVKSWRFPAPADHGLVIVTLGFDFSLK